MAMSAQGECQGDLMVSWSEMPRSPGHVFYDRLQEIPDGGLFIRDGFIEQVGSTKDLPQDADEVLDLKIIRDEIKNYFSRL